MRGGAWRRGEREENIQNEKERKERGNTEEDKQFTTDEGGRGDSQEYINVK